MNHMNMNQGNCQMPTDPMQQAQPVICPPQYRYHDQFTPRQVPVVHPIVNVNRQHTVDIPRHYYTETTENVMGSQMVAMPGRGPGMGCGRGRGCGGFGRRGRSPWM